LLVAGGVGLFASLFLTWSHQYPRSLLAVPGIPTALSGVVRDASAWHVYSAADVLLAALAVFLVATALVGPLRAQAVALCLAAVALVFVVHALSAPPTNGANVVIPGTSREVRSLARAGPGETVAIVSLSLAIVGAAMTIADRRR
jgi:hypothetical protein